jgi:hypothetical protein
MLSLHRPVRARPAARRSVLDAVIRTASVATPHEDPIRSTRLEPPPLAQRAKSFHVKSGGNQDSDEDEVGMPMLRRTVAPSSAAQPAKPGAASRMRHLQPAPVNPTPAAGKGGDGLEAPLLGVAGGGGEGGGAK